MGRGRERCCICEHVCVCLCVCIQKFTYICKQNYIYIYNSKDLASTTLPPSPPPPSIGRHLNPAQGKHEECSEIEKVKDSCGTYDLANKKKLCLAITLPNVIPLAECSLIKISYFCCEQLILILFYRIWQKMMKNHTFISYLCQITY